MHNANKHSPMEASDVVGYVAGTLTTIALVPQAWRTFRTRDVSGISLRMYGIFTLGIATWLAYGIMLREVPMIGAEQAIVGEVHRHLLRAHRALRAMQPGQVLKVLTDSERTIAEFQALAKYVLGYELLSQEQIGDEVIHVLRRKR